MIPALAQNAVRPTQCVDPIPSSCCDCLVSRIQAIWQTFCSWLTDWANWLFSTSSPAQPELKEKELNVIASPDAFYHIMKYLWPQEMAMCEAVCKTWKLPDKVWKAQCEQQGVDQTFYEGKYKTAFPKLLSHAFGPKEWKQYFGVDVEKAPRLPPQIFRQLAKLKETHTLTLIPKAIDNKELSINAFASIAEKSWMKLNVFNNVLEKYGNEPTGRSLWVWMEQEVKPESRGKTQAQAEQDYPGQLGKSLWIIVSVVAHCVRHKICLFPVYPHGTYTRTCDGKYNHWFVEVGSSIAGGVFRPSELTVRDWPASIIGFCNSKGVAAAVPAEMLDTIGT